ncbi:hypothetical protein ANAEL_00827 [Anaerolineales bacterium]|nr:hypothetical protein ANAEL_00827 [Anaerolineales bacterium]
MPINTPEELDRDLTQAFGELCSVFSEGIMQASWTALDRPYDWSDMLADIVKDVQDSNRPKEFTAFGHVYFTMTVPQARLIQSFADLLGHWVTLNPDPEKDGFIPYTLLKEKVEA